MLSFWLEKQPFLPLVRGPRRTRRRNSAPFCRVAHTHRALLRELRAVNVNASAEEDLAFGPSLFGRFALWH